jgi:hypothetical protein
MEMKDAIIQTAADAIEKLSFPDGILPLGIEGRRIIAETAFEAIRSLLSPGVEIDATLEWWMTDDCEVAAVSENAHYVVDASDDRATVIVHADQVTHIEVRGTLADALRVAEEHERTLTAIRRFREAFPVPKASADPKVPSLVYRMHDFDDWGLIRNRDGSVFASLRRPVPDDEMAIHRSSGTDPYQALGLLLVDAVERVRRETDSMRNPMLSACLTVVDQYRARSEQASEDIRASSWERAEARYHASAAAAIHKDMEAFIRIMPVEPVPLDDIAVDRFAEAMKKKLAKKRTQGYGGWNDPSECTTEFLSDLLVDHVRKGDPVDVGNFAMMIHQRGATIANDRERYADMAKNRPHHKFEFPTREKLRSRIMASPDGECEAGTLHPEAPEPTDA